MNNVSCALAAALLTIATPAIADTQAQSKTISKADLDMNDPRDVAFLLRRIERAADEVCGQPASHMHPMLTREFRECRDETIETTVARLDEPLLDSVYVERHGPLEDRFAQR